MNKISAMKRLTNKLYGFSGVYMITIKEHSYIGSTKNIRNRIKYHIHDLNRETNKNHNLQNVYNKYGRGNMYFCILEICDKNLLEREKYWIDTLEPDLNINRDPTLKDTTWQYNKNGKHIYQYNLNGEYVGEYESAKEAGRVFNVDGSKFAAAANENLSQIKSAYGYLWSYIKHKRLSYHNGSSESRARKVYLFNILTGEETYYKSAAEAARCLFPDDDYSLVSACIIASCKGRNIIKDKYIARYDNNNYIVPHRCLSLININTLEIYHNQKDLCKRFNLSIYTFKRLKKDWITLTEYARVKLRESGKTIYDGNPNPSATEM